ncbi:hypothetical protein ADICYQ_5205 [Cyclobacterium qasimii M12-11B]|uniref:Uncharacterized protein n=1 Tax=Cyclobacterium qasimii M12-11B TaxID=641524 RepID=S7V794_9BACT|nr:hypothetical protein ADICYQ_5205 [Cyclobacterium qasimii M12-11B]
MALKKEKQSLLSQENLVKEKALLFTSNAFSLCYLSDPRNGYL